MSRGRHRRRNRGRALRAVLAGTALALTAAATMISASQATVGDDLGALRPLTSSGETGKLRLTEHLEPQRTLERLSSSMGKPIGVDAVLDSTDHTLRDASGCTTTEKQALPVEPAATRAYCWDSADTHTWRAGAVTSSGDADDDGWWGANRVLLSGWTGADGTAERGLAKVAFVDANDLDHLTYTWVLLTVPVDGGRDYRGLVSGISGMVWYQGRLLVATGSALYVYDMDRVQRTSVNSPAIGRVPGGWSAHGYRFMMPAVASYTMAAGTCGSASGVPPCLDSLSLDRSTTPDSLVASEWVPADSDRDTRLWRYSFSSAPARAGLPAVSAAGNADPTEAYETKATEVRGVLSYRPAGAARSRWYLSRAATAPDGHGTLWRQDTGGTRAMQCGSGDTDRCWSPRTESLSYWEVSGELWSQSGRTLFSLPLSSIDRSLG